jgi:hypothetical protein
VADPVVLKCNLRRVAILFDWGKLIVTAPAYIHPVADRVRHLRAADIETLLMRELAIRAIGHTCITLNYDTGVSCAITDRELDTIEQLLKYYATATAAAALSIRLATKPKDGARESHVSTRATRAGHEFTPEEP